MISPRSYVRWRHAGIPLMLAFALSMHAQDTTPVKSLPPPGKWYYTSGSELIFSNPILDVNGSDRGGVVRFAPVFQYMGLANHDISDQAGFFTGLSIRNLGFIYDDPNSGYRYKYRTYNVGIPAGVKVGRMHGTLFYAGYEIELPFNYKEKRFANERKDDKFNVWLSDRTEPWFHSVFFGIQGPGKADLTFRYYITNFHNTGYTETVDGVTTMPYAGLNSNVLCISLAFGLFNGERLIPVEPWGEPRRPDVHASR